MEKLQAKANDDAESGEEEAQVGLEATEDGCAPIIRGRGLDTVGQLLAAGVLSLGA